MRLARVFATKTNMCPNDPDTYFGEPDLFTPKYDEVHISVTFTWAIWRAMMLKKAWETHSKKVRIGGPAFDDPGGNFVAGTYLKKGVTITTRGCPHNCWFCFVPKREGKLRELPIVSGNIIQDNNLLAASKSHLEKVFQMLSKQKRINFAGGLQASRITDEIVEKLRNLSIYQLWLSFDYPEAEKSLIKAVNKLKRYFRRDQIRCYVLIGYLDDTLPKAETRLRRAWEIGTLPFAMLYRDRDEDNNQRTKQWKQFQRQWTRPAIIKSLNKGGKE